MRFLAIVALSVGAAVLYGIAHDQITARICVEYFTVGHPRIIQSESPTMLGLVWGVVATWWVGAALGVALGFAAQGGGRPQILAADLVRPISILLGVMAGAACLAAVIGYSAATAGAFSSFHEWLSLWMPTERVPRFVACLWAHSASYLVGFLGGATLCILTWRRRGRLKVPPSHEL